MVQAIMLTSMLSADHELHLEVDTENYIRLSDFFNTRLATVINVQQMILRQCLDKLKESHEDKAKTI